MADTRSFFIRNVVAGEMSPKPHVFDHPDDPTDPLILKHIVGIQDCYIWWDDVREGWVVQGAAPAEDDQFHVYEEKVDWPTVERIRRMTQGGDDG